MNEAEFQAYLAANGFTKTGQSEYAVDMDTAEHTHDFGFAARVISGQFRLVTAAENRILNPGDVWTLEPNVPHSEEVLGGVPVTFMYGVKG